MMVRLVGKLAVIEHLGSIGRAIQTRLTSQGCVAIPFDEWCESNGSPDIAICTSGKMIIRHPSKVDSKILNRMWLMNYAIPRQFTELVLTAGAKLIIHIGSNSARYGKSGAEDYAALKAALWKYCEIRGSLAAKENGARIMHIGLGGVCNSFWDHVRKDDCDLEIAETNKMIPEAGKGLTNEEVAELIVSLCRLPENVAVKDMLVTGRAYQ